MAIDLDYYDFFSIFNDTFFKNSVYDPVNKTYSFEPDFAVKNDEKNFITPEKKSSSSYKVTLNKKFLPIFSKNCFQNVFEENKFPDFIYFLTLLNIMFIDEFCLSSISLCLMLCLLAYYNELYIRFYIINRLFDGDINEYDKDSEKFTKVTHKVWELTIFFIAIYFQIFNISKIDSGIWAAKLLMNNNCFLLNNPPPDGNPDLYKGHVNEQLAYYIDFLTKLNQIMMTYLIVLLAIFISLILVCFSYLFVVYVDPEDEEVVMNTEIEMKKLN